MMEWTTLYLLMCFCTFSNGSFIKHFEFENVAGGPGKERSPWRSDASEKAALHVFKGDIVTLQFCIQDPSSLTVENVVISNDGQNDRMSWTLDEEPFASLIVPGNNGDWGHLWNRFKSTGQIGQTTKLETGKHTLVITVEDTDCYGSEMDYMNVSVDYDIQDDLLFCGYTIVPTKKPSICPSFIYPYNSTENGTMSSETTFTDQPLVPSKSLSSDTFKSKEYSEINARHGYTEPKVNLFDVTTESVLKIFQDSTLDFFEFESTTAYNDILSTEITTPLTTTTRPKFIIFPVDIKKKKQPISFSNLGVSLFVVSKNKKTAKDAKYNPNDPLSFLILPDLPDLKRDRNKLIVAPSRITTESIPYLVQQQSFSSNCPEESNVQVRFNPTDLAGTELIARQLSRVRLKRVVGARQVPFSCKTDIWNIGIADNDNKEFGPETTDASISLRVSSNDHNTKVFPKKINTNMVKNVYLRYQIPDDFDVSTGFLRITIGLMNVSSEVMVGIQNVQQNNPNQTDSKVTYKTFRPSRQVIFWDIQPQNVARFGENTLHITFKNNTDVAVRFDTLKLEFKISIVTQRKDLGSYGKFITTGERYDENRGHNNGFKVFVNGQRKEGTFSKFHLLRRPRRSVLSISESGKIFINHSTGRRRRSRKKTIMASSFLKPRHEISGFSFGPLDPHKVDEVRINPQSSLVAVTFTDSNYVVMKYSYSRVRSKLVIVDTSFKSVTFFSTYMSEDLTAVNSVTIDNATPINVMSKIIDGVIGKRFKFVKNTANPILKANDEIEVVLP